MNCTLKVIVFANLGFYGAVGVTVVKVTPTQLVPAGSTVS